ncbi:hypothetical protein BJ875DRAFT_520064 [Amylocarpus encephaloides]|uniref:Uncharacterized protein n=1 Tax=Amylocarpus encephaloides TaxID=45428 RepID=A0A9P8C302_9HELO|nr:hypothetical protein BJ875DRAFT_520064 [Amylocarpus encephaloides]
MREAREEVSECTRTLTTPSSLVEASLTRAINQNGPAIIDFDEEALQLLVIERDALATAWSLLKEDLVEEGKDDSIMGPAPETFESVIATAADAKTEMNSRKRLGGGQPRDYYDKLCQKAHQHKSVFSIFPNTDKYASASVNYIQISEGLSKAFDEITELVDFAKRRD